MRIYHPYTKWEDYPLGFYDNCSGEVKEAHIKNVLIMFRSEKLTRKNMMRVIREWKYCCEHNLSNESLNKIAYIGQAACCIFAGVPSTVTMEAWNLLDKETQERANKIAIECLMLWQSKNKNIQLCLNLD